MRVLPRRSTTRGAALLVALVMALAGSACAPSPDGSTGLTPDQLFGGGSYPIELVVEPQTLTSEFSFFGLATCTSTVVTPSADLTGTLTLTPAEMSPDLRIVTIPGATLELPGSTISLGSVSLTCDGTRIGTAGLSLRFDGAASVQAAVLDTDAATVTLADPTIELTNVQVSFSGAAAGTPPLDLDPITLAIPTLDVDL